MSLKGNAFILGEAHVLNGACMTLRFSSRTETISSKSVLVYLLLIFQTLRAQKKPNQVIL